jgi:VWFA-related protein
MRSTARVALGVAAAILASNASSTRAQPPADAVPPASPKRSPLVVRIGVDVVQIDAVVTDKKGRAVADLNAGDFEILQDNRSRPVSYARYVVADTAPLAASVDGADAPSGRAPLRPEEVRRSMVFVVDSLSPTGMYATREALTKLVNEDLRAGDLVAIVRVDRDMGLLQQFTSDRRVLQAAVDRLVYRPGVGDWNPDVADGYCHDDGYLFARAPYPMGDPPVATLNAIDFVLEGLRELPGRKSVVLFSESLSLFERTDFLGRPSVPDPDIIDAVRQVTDLANRGSVVIYTVDPGGLRTGGFSAARAWSGPRSRGFAEAPSDSLVSPFVFGDRLGCRATQELNARSGLEILARQTGGLFFRNENRVSAAVGEVFEDQKGYYVIGYTPDEQTFARSTRGPVFHNLKVRVKREGLRVRSRAGFIGVTDADDVRPAPEKVEHRLLRAMASPFVANDLPVRLTAVFGHDPARGYVVRSLVHVDGARLTFVERDAGGHEARLELAAAVFGDNGVVVQDGNHEVRFQVAPENVERLRQDGVVIDFDIVLGKPGPYQLRVALRDPATGTTGTASQFVPVPDLSKPRLALSGIVLESKPAAAHAPDPRSPSVATDEARMSPARRRFVPGTDLRYAFAVYNPAIDRRTGEPRLGTELRLVRAGVDVFKADMAPTRTLTPLALASREKKKVKAVPGYAVTGAFRLPADLEPGEYALQILVTDQLTEAKVRRSAQWTELEVLGVRTGARD